MGFNKRWAYMKTGAAKKRRRRPLDLEATLAKYRSRIENLPIDVIHELEGVYISTFEVYNTIASMAGCSSGVKRCAAVQLLDVARRRGGNVKAVTSERKRSDRYLCHKLLEGDTRDNSVVVYVGQYNFFTGHSAHPVFSVIPEDKVFQG